MDVEDSITVLIARETTVWEERKVFIPTLVPYHMLLLARSDHNHRHSMEIEVVL